MRGFLVEADLKIIDCQLEDKPMASKISIREFSPFILLILAIVSILFTSAITNRNAAALDTVPVKISALLSDYSQNIGNLADKKFLQSKNY